MEDVVDPGLLICDPHHHLWDHPGDRYMIDELMEDMTSGHRVASTVFVECDSGYRSDGPHVLRPVGETDLVVAADPAGLIAGVIGFADLREPGVEDVLAAHVEAGRGRFRGIRSRSAWDPGVEVPPSHTHPPAGLLGEAAFGAGVAALGRAGLSFDAWLYHPQIPELTALARAHPETLMVLDHLGGPLGIGRYRRRRDDVLAEWRSSMTELASCANVVVKLGGVGMPMYGMRWHHDPGSTTSEDIAESWGRHIRWCIEAFGVSRCMFESNFPVDRLSCSYRVLWNAFKLIAAEATATEKAALFHDTAVAVYRLG